MIAVPFCPVLLSPSVPSELLFCALSTFHSFTPIPCGSSEAAHCLTPSSTTYALLCSAVLCLVSSLLPAWKLAPSASSLFSSHLSCPWQSSNPNQAVIQYRPLVLPCSFSLCSFTGHQCGPFVDCFPVSAWPGTDSGFPSCRDSQGLSAGYQMM